MECCPPLTRPCRRGRQLPCLPRLRASAWRALRLLVANARQRMEVVVLCLPPQRVAALKAAAAGADAGATPITTGDAVQAMGALLAHAAAGEPLVPSPPRALVVLVQAPTPPSYFGNAVHLLPVSHSRPGAPLPAADDYPGALAAVAALIRQATAKWRGSPVSQAWGLAAA